MQLLKGKNILLGVTGSIAAYKSVELCRLLIKAGANVRVIMSEEAKRFVGEMTFEAITSNRVLHEGTEDWASELNHIHVHKNIDLFCIAPASVNTINKLSCGICDNLLLQTAVASPKKLLIAPSANTHMMENFATKKSIEILKEQGHIFVEPISKLLACKVVGNGALAEVETIYYAIIKELLKDERFIGQNVIVTGGGTSEKIDEVRVLTNNSSGKMAKNLALALYFRGANVTLLTSSDEDYSAYPFKVEKYKSSSQLKKLLSLHVGQNETLFMAAAVSDFVLKEQINGKIKKDVKDNLTLNLVKNEDLLSGLSDKIRSIGFKAEVNESEGIKNAKEMLNKKNLHAVCLNVLENEVAFGSDKTKMTLFFKDKSVELPLEDKLTVSLKIIEEIF